ncbi:TraB/GumN family protein [Massilia sp. G4R7]|uniref:TraB/GumN family protein n=1 Tax=Massilia phyllostachyos TaxID=2898585 RepID=A0ABS8Q7N4_9BURK|nr:TraB/GumN family protein [Massilia phyllostachyos]MCD2517759.1 TraB/GumN family protein [Massilia phyllostachyos]
MRRPIIVVFFSLFLMAFQALAAERGALFKVSSGANVLHLYGTVHAGRPDFYPLEPRIGAAMGAAPTLALELDSNADPAAMGAIIMKHAMFPTAAEGLPGLPEARRQRLETSLRKQGIEPAAVGQMKPWLLVVTLAMVDAAKLGYDPKLGVDAHLASLAKSSGKTRVIELESMDYQIGLFNRMPVDDQWTMLEDTLADMESGRHTREARELFAAYESADQAALERVAKRLEEDNTVGGKFTREVLMVERNGPMADKIVSLVARENNAVVAVGLLHLVGKNGVPELLRKRGVKVERVY